MDPQSDDQVVRLLGSLKRVNAPENFESRVRARLLAAPTPARNFGFLKLAVPAGALAALALFLLLSGYVGRDMPSTDVVVADEKQTETKAVQPATPVAENLVITNESTQLSKEFRAGDIPQTQPPAAVNSPTFRVNSPLAMKSRQKSLGGQSYDIGSDPKDKVILPPGFDPDKRASGNRSSEREMRRPSIAASDLLRYTGVSMELRGNEWVASSVVQKSPAERIGLKAGDIIVSLNDIRLGKATVFPSGVDLKTIRVKRGGNIVDLNFSPR